MNGHVEERKKKGQSDVTVSKEVQLLDIPRTARSDGTGTQNIIAVTVLHNQDSGL